MTKLSKATTDIVTNAEVIAVDQDALGLQCVKVDEATAGLQVWAKPLAASGKLAVLLLNRTFNSSAPITVHWSELGLDPSSPVAVRDLWAQKDLGSYPASYTSNVPAGDAVMLTAKGKEGEATRYENASPGNGVANAAAPRSTEGLPSSQSATLAGERTLTFKTVTSTARSAYIQIAYTNGDKAPRLAELRVNGEIATRIAFPPTGGEHAVGNSHHRGADLKRRAQIMCSPFRRLGKLGPGVVWI